jgi:hypothetical protein
MLGLPTLELQYIMAFFPIKSMDKKMKNINTSKT